MYQWLELDPAKHKTQSYFCPWKHTQRKGLAVSGTPKPAHAKLFFNTPGFVLHIVQKS